MATRRVYAGRARRRGGFTGSDNGQENKRKAPPFQALENEAEDEDSDDPIEDQVAEWCADNAPHPSENGNGNGNGNGN